MNIINFCWRLDVTEKKKKVYKFFEVHDKKL